MNNKSDVRYPFVPTEIVVHLGKPDEAARNIKIPFIEYIKNVASSEVYPNWPESAIRANVLAQVSFALNRIYNEWYRCRGYNYDITNDPEIDQAFVEGRELYDNINKIVDSMFNDYIVIGEQIQPHFAQYCDGVKTVCEGLSQWGTVELAKQGKNAFEIIRYYYGPNARVVYDAPLEENIESYPGSAIELGDAGETVTIIQKELNRISNNYPLIPKIEKVTGVFDIPTENSVKKFQEIFNLAPTGIVSKPTWYKIKLVYNSVKKLADLYSEGILVEEADLKYGNDMQYSDVGNEIRALNYYLSVISLFDRDIPSLTTDDIFDENTKDMVLAFQNKYGLPVTGVVDALTWDKIQEVYLQLINSVPSQYVENLDELYPGYYLTKGMTGDDVKRLQGFLYKICVKYKSIPGVRINGVFDELTEASVMKLQERFDLPVDGAVGPVLWSEIVKLSKA